MNDINTLSDRIRQVAYDIHVYHGHGHLENVYENALANRLIKAGLKVKQQHPSRCSMKMARSSAIISPTWWLKMC